MVETAKGLHDILECVFACMAKGWMANVMREAQSFGQILVKAQGARDCAPNLRDLKTVCQADAVVIAVGRDKDLSLVAQPSKGDGVDDTVTVALEYIAWPAHFTMRFRVQPAAAAVGMRCIRSQLRHRALMPPSCVDGKRLFHFQLGNGNADFAFPHETVTACLFVVAIPLLRSFLVGKGSNQ
jgi:hypothetical protein